MNAMPALMNGTFSPYCSVMRVFNMKFFRVPLSLTRLTICGKEGGHAEVEF
jgi:hypothetical protein